MYNNAEHRLVAIRNELRAQKTAAGMASDSLTTPAEMPEVTWSGNVNVAVKNAEQQFLATFTRTDGLDLPPLVDFTVNAEFSPSPEDIVRAYGTQASVSGAGSLNAAWRTGASTQLISSSEPGKTSAIIVIDRYGFFETMIVNTSNPQYKYPNPILKVTIQAISLVNGILTVEKLP